MAAVIFDGERIGALRGKGAERRQDGFFNETPVGHNAAREVAEGVLLTARGARNVLRGNNIARIGCAGLGDAEVRGLHWRPAPTR